MNPELRNSAAHLFVDSVDAPALSVDHFHHLSHVLRLRNGESVTCSDGRGSWRVCTWVDGSLVADGEVRSEPAPDPVLSVAISPVKGDRTDLVVEKLVEIGIDAIVVLAPVERSVVRWTGDKTVAVMERYGRIVRSAAMQSRRVHLPVLSGPVALSDVISAGAAVAEPGGTADWSQVTTVVVGPEGGFAPAEIAPAQAMVDLGPAVLRAETAAIVAGARMVAHWRR